MGDLVYEEFLGLERRGLSVIPISVHRPPQVGRGQEALVERTLILYDGSRLGMLIQGLVWAPANPEARTRVIKRQVVLYIYYSSGFTLLIMLKSWSR